MTIFTKERAARWTKTVLRSRMTWFVGAPLLFITLTELLNMTSHKERYVDVRSGRMRYVVKVCGIRMRDEVIETEFSALWLRFVGTNSSPSWRLESRVPLLGGISPHYGYHGVTVWQNCMVTAFEVSTNGLGDATNAFRTFLGLLESDNPRAAETYAETLVKAAVLESGAR